MILMHKYLPYILQQLLGANKGACEKTNTIVTVGYAVQYLVVDGIMRRKHIAACSLRFDPNPVASHLLLLLPQQCPESSKPWPNPQQFLGVLYVELVRPGTGTLCITVLCADAKPPL